MAVAANFGSGIHLSAFFLKVTDKHHLVIIVQERLTVFLLGDRGECLLVDRCYLTLIRLLFACRVQDAPDPFFSRATEWRSPDPLTSTREENSESTSRLRSRRGRLNRSSYLFCSAAWAPLRLLLVMNLFPAHRTHPTHSHLSH